jgi:hypothetical protein
MKSRFLINLNCVVWRIFGLQLGIFGLQIHNNPNRKFSVREFFIKKPNLSWRQKFRGLYPFKFSSDFYKIWSICCHTILHPMQFKFSKKLISKKVTFPTIGQFFFSRKGAENQLFNQKN